MIKGWIVVLIMTIGLVLGGLAGWDIGRQEVKGYQTQMSELQNELTVCEQNYELAIDVLNEQNITRGLPADDQIANILEGITDNGTVKYDVTLNFHLENDGTQTGDITISLKRGDKVDTD